MSVLHVRPAPTVQLKVGGNPWAATLEDTELLQILLDAAWEGEERIAAWIKAGQAQPDAVFAQVYLDPTNPRDQDTIKKRIFAVVLYGASTRALEYLPSAIARADVADRHPGRSNGQLVDNANFCLGDNGNAGGDSACYHGAVSAGSGLLVSQNRELAQRVLELTMHFVHGARDSWLRRCRDFGHHDWYNPGNVHGEQYQLTFGVGEWHQAGLLT